jgi:hypothetical protein
VLEDNTIVIISMRTKIIQCSIIVACALYFTEDYLPYNQSKWYTN